MVRMDPQANSRLGRDNQCHNERLHRLAAGGNFCPANRRQVPEVLLLPSIWVRDTLGGRAVDICRPVGPVALPPLVLTDPHCT